MEKDWDRYLSQQSESESQVADGTRSDAEKKKKKSKKSSGLSYVVADRDPNLESKRKKEEKEKVSKAVAKIFVEGDVDTEKRAEPERSKKRDKSEKEADDAHTKVEAEAIPEDHIVALQPERLREAVERAHNNPESDDEDPDEVKETDEKPGRPPERNHDQAAPKQWLELELPLRSAHADKEIVLPLQGNESVVEQANDETAEPEPIPEAVSEYVPDVETAESEEAPRVSVTMPPTMYQRQPEQQQQARDFAFPELAEPATFIAPEWKAPHNEATLEGVSPVDHAEAIEPETPMVPVSESIDRLEPAEAYRLYAEREAAQQRTGGTSAEEVVSKQAAEAEAYYAARSAQNRGFVTGLFVAGLWGHFRRKGLKRQFGQAIKRQEKKIRQLREDHHFHSEAQTRKQAEGERRLGETQQHVRNLEQQLKRREPNRQPLASGVERQVSQPGYREANIPQPGHAEQQIPQRNDPDVAEQLAVPPTHRLETSAWHTIEVDARTGRAVEQPTFAYGHEYYQERAHEAPPVTQRNAAAGEVVLSAMNAQDSQVESAGSGTSDDSSSPLPPLNIPSASRQGPPPSQERSKDGKGRGSLPVSISSAGPIWPFVLALLVIFICLVYLL